MRNTCVLAFILMSSLAYTGVKVELDTSEVPKLDPWGKKAKKLVEDWHQRIANMLPSSGFVAPSAVKLKIKKSDKGVAHTADGQIVVMSGWIEKHPEDIGCVFHELVHVIQRYPGGAPFWVTEGIADYMRWAIYEGKPQNWFPMTNKPNGYTQGYRVAGGFLLWVETEVAPGMVKKMNTAARKQKYTDEIFKKDTGRTVQELWKEYVKARGK